MNLITTEEQLNLITENLDPFWGSPTKYSIMGKFDDVKLSDDASAEPVDVMRIKFNLKLSTNYYAYQRVKDSSYELPADQTEAAAVAAALPEIMSEIYRDVEGGGEAAPYAQALAVHDWLALNLTYDETIDKSSPENGIYGAIVDRNTMCQGYAEAFQLILLCAGDVRAKMEIGYGDNGNGEWVGHAWNLVFMEDRWYQVDTTFNDPIGNPDDKLDHAYFGQNDACMRVDHQWVEEYWPAADGTDFLYYRKSGLYAEDFDTFQAIVTSQFESGQPADVEVAIRGFEVNEDNLQFVYSTNDAIDMVYWRTLAVGGATVVHIEPEYQ
jgi:transglutaminase-like putative cysteine protease